MSSKKKRNATKRKASASRTSSLDTEEAAFESLEDSMTQSLIENCCSILGYFLSSQNEKGLVYFVIKENHAFADSFFEQLESLCGIPHNKIQMEDLKDLERLKEMKGPVLIKGSQDLSTEMFLKLSKFPNVIPVVYIEEKKVTYSCDMRKIMQFLGAEIGEQLVACRDFTTSLHEAFEKTKSSCRLVVKSRQATSCSPI